MPRSIQGRRNDQQNVRGAQIRSRRGGARRAVLTTSGRSDATTRLIGLPITATFPKIKNIRWRFCTRWDEEPAAALGKSLLRLRICRPDDWAGSAVDFVERGFNRFCKQHGSHDLKNVWVGDLRIMDFIFDLSARDRDAAKADIEDRKSVLYLVGDYEAAASIPVGATLPHLEREHELLPAAFYEVLTTNLWKWMRVYDYAAAKEHSDMWTEDLSEEEVEGSVYPKLETELPECIGSQLKKFNYQKALRFLEQIVQRIRGSVARQLIRHILEMDGHGRGYTHAWPGRIEKEMPEVGDWLADAEDSRPGCLITWYEDDAVNACFDEEAQHMGENGPCQPNVLLGINLNKPIKIVDQQVGIVFDHAAAMLRSLASAAKAVEIIREFYDEHLREHRLKSGLQTEPSPAGVRQE